MYLKIHYTKNGSIVAACDATLLGKIIEEGEKVIDLKKYRNFYCGKKCDKKQLVDALNNCSSANLVGKKVVAVAKEAGLINNAEIMYIKSFPYVHIYQI